MARPSAHTKLFALETLDLRFTTSSRAPLPDPVAPEGPKKSGTVAANASPPLWRTPEFFFYYLVFVVCIPLMFKAVYDVSQSTHPNYTKFEHLLSPGWIAGRKVDNSDKQYSFFRDNIPYMLVLLFVHPLLRALYDRLCGRRGMTNRNSPHAEADQRLEQRLRFDFVAALIYISVLHGFSALKVLLILYINYSIAKNLPRPYIVPTTWIFCMATLFANELCEGYPYRKIVSLVLHGYSDPSASNWGTVLDGMGGLVSRWEVLFNITILRLISFNCDYCWSLDRLHSNSLEKKQLDASNLSERDRVDISLGVENFTFRNYLAYALYAPLYLAGPILTFNDFLAQCRYPLHSISAARTFRYGLRFFASLLAMEVMIHYIYAVAICQAQPSWETYSPFQVSMLGYFNLHHIWLKLLLPWRFFRLWALVDGIDPPENMVRCVSNNYSGLAFWRGWHRSFNRWIVRYIYVPLGGSSPNGSSGLVAKLRTAFNYVTVFTFVAVWHDINLRVLMWGWLVVIFIIPEVLGTIAFPRRKWADQRTAYRVICGVGAVANILMMMTANLVGFVLGVDGITGFIHGIIGSYLGILYVFGACGALFVGVQVMFETREEEHRKGIKMNC